MPDARATLREVLDAYFTLDVDEAGQSPAMGSTTGSVWTRDDGGDSWRTVSSNLPAVYAVRFAKM